MKYCQHCGSQMVDEAIICVNCGCAAQDINANTNAQAQSTSSTLKLIAKIFMIIGCVASASFFFIPLCWTIPMTVYYWRAVENKTPVGVGFKVCSLIFVSVVAGILMLCDSENK